MSGHTPGPWAPGYYDGPQLFPLGARLVVVTNQPRTLVVAICGHDESERAAAAEADARLIAATPDLLAACHAMLTTFGMFEGIDDHQDPSVDRAIALTRAAIAKAEGK